MAGKLHKILQNQNKIDNAVEGANQSVIMSFIAGMVPRKPRHQLAIKKHDGTYTRGVTQKQMALREHFASQRYNFQARQRNLSSPFKGCGMETDAGGSFLVTNCTRLCQTPDCEKQAQAGGRCIAHGGTRMCKTPECKEQEPKGTVSPNAPPRERSYRRLLRVPSLP